jgi:hypothetical protein
MKISPELYRLFVQMVVDPSPPLAIPEDVRYWQTKLNEHASDVLRITSPAPGPQRPA